MQPDVLDRLPALDEIERAISLRAREARLLRTLRDALRRRQAKSGQSSITIVSAKTEDEPMAETLTPLMVDAADAARLIGVSKATWARMDSAGKTPAPVRLSPGCVRWRVFDLASWIDAGCPPRAEWQAVHEQGGPLR